MMKRLSRCSPLVANSCQLTQNGRELSFRFKLTRNEADRDLVERLSTQHMKTQTLFRSVATFLGSQVPRKPHFVTRNQGTYGKIAR